MLIAIQTSTPRAYPWKLILPKEYVEVNSSQKCYNNLVDPVAVDLANQEGSM